MYSCTCIHVVCVCVSIYLSLSIYLSSEPKHSSNLAETKQTIFQHVANRGLKVLFHVDLQCGRLRQPPPLESSIEALWLEAGCNEGPLGEPPSTGLFPSTEKRNKGRHGKRSVEMTAKWDKNVQFEDEQPVGLSPPSLSPPPPLPPPAFHSLSAPIHLLLPLPHPFTLNQMACFFC